MEISEEFINKQIEVLSSQLELLHRLKKSFSKDSSQPKRLTKKEKDEIVIKKLKTSFYKNKRT